MDYGTMLGFNFSDLTITCHFSVKVSLLQEKRLSSWVWGYESCNPKFKNQLKCFLAILKKMKWKRSMEKKECLLIPINDNDRQRASFSLRFFEQINPDGSTQKKRKLTPTTTKQGFPLSWECLSNCLSLCYVEKILGFTTVEDRHWPHQPPCHSGNKSGYTDYITKRPTDSRIQGILKPWKLL